MSELLVISFESEEGATAALKEITVLVNHEVIKVDDCATAVRYFDGKVKVKQANILVGVGAIGGAFWGLFFGLLFFVPFLGSTVGAATGAIFGKAEEYGINDDFIYEVSESVQPGNSAIFLITDKRSVGTIVSNTKSLNGKVFQASLSKQEEVRLQDAFSS